MFSTVAHSHFQLNANKKQWSTVLWKENILLQVLLDAVCISIIDFFAVHCKPVYMSDIQDVKGRTRGWRVTTSNLNFVWLQFWLNIMVYNKLWQDNSHTIWNYCSKWITNVYLCLPRKALSWQGWMLQRMALLCYGLQVCSYISRNPTVPNFSQSMEHIQLSVQLSKS